MPDFAIVCFKWKGPATYRTQYEARHVNTLRSMFERCLELPHDFICITDDASDLDPRIRVIPLWRDFGNLPSYHGPREPSCFRRLRLFAKDAGELLGVKRFLWCDLDVVLTADVTPIFDRPEPIVLLPARNPRIPFNGSLVLMDAGARPEVYESFNPVTSPHRNFQARCYGSDQGHISYCLKDKGEATWKAGPNGDGIYFVHRDNIGATIPDDARLISFHGRYAPWSVNMRDRRWIKDHYR